MKITQKLPGRAVAVLAGAAMLAAGAVLFCPPSVPSPAYLADARELEAGRPIVSDFEKVGYPVLLWAGLAAGGMRGIHLAQAALYLGVVALAAGILTRLGIRGPRFFWAAALIALYPYLLLNITRIVDTNLSAVILLGLVFLLVLGSRTGTGPGWAAAAGLICGYAWLTRPNYILILTLFPLLIIRERTVPRRRRAARLAIMAVCALGLTAAVTRGVCGRVRILTTDGGYTLFTGANPWTGQQLISNYNTEGRTPRNLRRLGIDPGRDDLDRVYLDLSLRYIRENPGNYLWLGVLKTVNLFRPDYRRVENAAPGPSRLIILLLQTALALPFPIWAAVRICRGRKIGWSSPLRAGVILALYLVPFFFLSTDPRYRLPLDLLLILDTSRTLYLTSRRRH